MPACVECASPAVVQWSRRPTAAELDAAVAAEEARRDQILLLADPEAPPQFGPLPTRADIAVTVYACARHAISPDLATRVHQDDCLGPASPALPTCSCTPEPLPEPEPAPAAAELPPGW